jgi:hypothetical protein
MFDPYRHKMRLLRESVRSCSRGLRVRNPHGWDPDGETGPALPLGYEAFNSDFAVVVVDDLMHDRQA